MTEKRAGGYGSMPSVMRSLPRPSTLWTRIRMREDPAFRLNPSIRVPGRTAEQSARMVRMARNMRHDLAARANPELSVARRGPQRVKRPTRSATRAITNIRANLIIPSLPGLSQALRFLTKRDLSGTAPGAGTRVVGQVASNVSGLRQSRAPRPRPAAPRATAR